MKSPHLHSTSEFYYVNTNPIVSTLFTAITTTTIHNVPAVFSTFSLAAFFCSGMCEPSDPLYRPHLSSITLHYLSQFTLSLTFHSIIFRITLTFTIAFMIFWNSDYIPFTYTFINFHRPAILLSTLDRISEPLYNVSFSRAPPLLIVRWLKDKEATEVCIFPPAYLLSFVFAVAKKDHHRHQP